MEVAVGGSFYDDPDGLVWTDVSGVGSLSTRQGRDSWSDRRPVSYSFSFTVGAGAPVIVPGMPVRWSCQDETGAWRPVGYGLVDEAPPTFVGTEQFVTVTVLDGLARLGQAGPRLAYRDRLILDTAGVYGLDGAGDVEAFPAGLIHPMIGTTDVQRWGLAWFTPSPAGSWTGGVGPFLDWDESGAIAPLADTGGLSLASVTTVGGASYNLTGFASDRAGGCLVASGSAVRCTVVSNWSRQQVTVGRPPAQMLPAAVCDPVDATGWAASAGALARVAADSLAWTARRVLLDGGVSVVDGPAGALEWSPTASGQTLRTAQVAVTAGVWYGMHVCLSGPAVRVGLQWLDSGGSVLSTEDWSSSSGVRVAWGAGSAGTAGRCWQAPVGAVAARLQVTSTAAGTLQLHAPGIYRGAQTGLSSDTIWYTPRRWWPPGAEADLHLWGQWAQTVATTGTEWLHVDVVLPDDGQRFAAWNVNPGVDGAPVFWLDGEPVGDWSVTDPGTAMGWRNFVSGEFGSEMGTSVQGQNATVIRVQQSMVDVSVGILGVENYDRAPDDLTVRRAWRGLGAPDSIDPATPATTDEAVTQILDSVGWPAALRDIRPCTTASTGQDGQAGEAISTLATTESGMVFAAPDGRFTWLPRRWYDPDGDGTTTARWSWTWRLGLAGWGTYLNPITLAFDASKVANHVEVTSTASGGYTAIREDLDSIWELGERALQVQAPWKTQADVDEVAGELIALYRRPRLWVDKLVFHSSTTPLSDLLSIRVGDVAVVEVPDLDDALSAIVLGYTHTSGGGSWSTQVSVAPIPVTAVAPPWTGPVFVGFDELGPYVDPVLAERGPRVAQDGDGYYYAPVGDLSVAVDADGPYMLEDT